MSMVIEDLEGVHVKAVENVDAVRTVEPQAFVLPSWLVEDYERAGGEFIGKTDVGDGYVTITGIAKFSNAYLEEVNRLVQFR